MTKQKLNKGFGMGIMSVIATCAIGLEVLRRLQMIEFNFNDYETIDIESNWKEMLEAVLGETIEAYKRPYHKKDKKHWKIEDEFDDD
jgi:hypothetical protein